jgi:hypothetical protein
MPAMGRIFGSLTLLIVVGVGLYVYTKDAAQVTPGGAAPTTMVDVTGVNNDLLALANAEKRYWASNAKYGSLEELQRNGDIQVPQRPSYKYAAEVSENSFKIIATYSGSDPKAPAHISIDETMALKRY